MSRRQPTALQAPPFFAPSSPYEITQQTAGDPVERLLERARTGQPLEPHELRRLARDSFEAGFAAGTARLTSAPAADTPNGALPHSAENGSSARNRSTRLNDVSRNDTTGAMRTATDAARIDPIATLSPRRLEVLQLVARGLTNREIGDVLTISANTVKAHLKSILEILDLTNRTEAAMALHEFEATR